MGPPRIERDGVVVRGFESRRALDLLCYVAVRGRPVPRRQLATMFWGEKPDARARANLSRVLHNLTHLLPDCLDVDRDAVALRSGVAWLDTTEFEREDAAGDLAALADAAELCRDEFMAAADVEDAPTFQEWLDGERRNWRRRLVSVLQRLADHRLRRREYAAAERYASRLLAVAPWSEEGHRSLMLALAGSGRRSEALQQFETCRRILAEELGVEPAAETQALRHRITAAAARPHPTLPAPPTPLVGRERELVEIAGRLADPDCRLLTLVGPAGIGKTRLALAAAGREADSFLDGAHFAPLAAVNSRRGLVAAVADAVAFAFHERGTAEDQICSYLADKTLLIVLDSFEHLLPAGADFLALLLARAPGVKLLVTSRQRLGAPAEWLFEVAGLDYPRDESPGIDAYAAVRLFRQAATRANPTFVLATDEGPVARVCRTVEGMPLAIELAAAWVRSLSCREIAAQIERDPALLTGHRRVPHHDLQTLFQDSWALLSAEEQAAFRRLCVCAGGFEAEAAAAIADASPTLLAGLIDKSFLRREPSGRYGVHELLRQYGLARLAADRSEERATQDRHAVYFLGFLREREGVMGGPRHRQVEEEISRDFANIRTAWGWALERGMLHRIAERSGALLMYLELRSRWEEGAELFGKAAALLEASSRAAPDGGRESREVLGAVLAHLGWCLHRLGDAGPATSNLQRGVELLRSFGSPRTTFNPFYFSGIAMWLSGDTSQAEELLNESVAAAGAVGAGLYESLATSMLGYLALERGQLEGAKTQLEAGLSLSQAAGAYTAQAFALLGLGRVAAARQEFGEARQLMGASLAISRETAHQFGLTYCLAELGAVARETGELDDSRRFFEESLRLSAGMGERWGVARALMGLGSVAATRGDATAAEKHLRDAVAQALAVQQPPLVTAALHGLAEVVATRGQEDQAVKLLAVVLQEPTTETQTRERATALWVQLGAGAPPQPAAEGPRRPLAETVQELLDRAPSAEAGARPRCAS